MSLLTEKGIADAYEQSELERIEQDRRDDLIDELTINCHHLPEYFEGHEQEILLELIEVLTDDGDDKLGRMTDIWFGYAEEYAEFKRKQHRLHGY